MAVKDESLFYASESLILSTQRKYYRAHMPAGHYQLRSFVAAPSPNEIYFLSSHDIYRLNTSTCTREVVTNLPFEPKCLTAVNNWICCGGERGKFAAIRLGSREGRFDFGNEADDQLPLHLDSVQRLDLGLLSDRFNRRSRPLARLRTIGVDIVNCITIWFPQPHPEKGSYKKPVALLANNDRTVSIVDLEELDILQTLEQDDCINLARISPDGQLLIAIGDDPYMHIYKREENNDGSDSHSAALYTWVKKTEVQLPSQRKDDQSAMKGSFTASFSRRYLAVGTQYGTICVFELQTLMDSESPRPFFTFTTTRPNTSDGAVRCLQFNPVEPIDLLAITEDDGRIVVADVRCLHIRQVIKIDSNADNVEHVNVRDRTSSSLIDPLLRHFLSEDEPETGNEDRSDNLRYRNVADEYGLSPEEMEVLEALQSQTRRREQMANRDRERETSPTWNDIVHNRSNLRSVQPRMTRNSLPGSLREFTNSRINDSLRTYILERNQERERGEDAHRRRALIASSYRLDSDAHDESPSSPGDIAAENTGSSSRLSLDVPPIGIRISNPWNDVRAEMQALYNMTADPPDSAARLGIEVEDENMRQTLQDADDFREIRRLNRDRIGRDPDHRNTIRAQVHINLGGWTNSAQTTGCAWSQDGRTLYVGTESGIYEYHVNVMSRKLFPSITYR